MIIIATISIVCLSFLIRVTTRFLPFKICPICGGVSGTWIWLVSGSLLGYQIDLTIPALLMGGSVVGLAYQLDKKLSHESSSFLWKVIFIPAGFIVAYSILMERWWMFITIATLLSGVSFLFLSPDKKSNSDKETTKKLKEEMDKCC